MKKWRDLKCVLEILLWPIVTICGVFGFIYDYLIWDKSIVPDIVYNAFAIPGYITLATLGVIYLIDYKKKKR